MECEIVLLVSYVSLLLLGSSSAPNWPDRLQSGLIGELVYILQIFQVWPSHFNLLIEAWCFIFKCIFQVSRGG